MGDYLNLLLEFSQKERSFLFRLVSLSLGAILFLVIVPLILINLAELLGRPIRIDWPRPAEIPVAFASTALGIIFVIWSIVSQWFIGKGTPAPAAPTQKLIVVGPYKLCRNPIQLGLVLYYLGIGTFWRSLTVGFTSFLTALVIGSFYHKFVEEKELLIRFGEEYRNYRERTPFLIPRFRR
jgi:protein-S-isoprenylcysteine O-methyltransferase Ste14